MLDADLDALLLYALEPDKDLADPKRAVEVLGRRHLVVAFTPYSSPALDRVAHLQLPIGTFAETAGTFVNCEGRWQSFTGIAKPVGEARPGWKVLRVLGNLLGLENCEYLSAADIRDELQSAVGEVVPDNTYRGTADAAKANGEDSPADEIDVPIYEVDAVVRRATALQMTPEARRSRGGDS
jgi:NADH-quinone oxidoreductase subunit G